MIVAIPFAEVGPTLAGCHVRPLRRGLNATIIAG